MSSGLVSLPSSVWTDRDRREECVRSAVLLVTIIWGSVCWTGPAVPCAEGSVEPAVERLFKRFHFCKMSGDGVLVQRIGSLRGSQMGRQSYIVPQE